MKIAVVGTGYVGLVQGTCLAESGNDVVCVDKVAAKIEGLRQGRVPIYEPGLGELVHRNMRDGRLNFTTDLPGGIAEAEIVFIAVGTPQGEHGGADLSGVWAVGRQIAEALRRPKVVVVKSTVPVGTNAELARRMSEATDVPFDVASNPEFLKEGAAIDDFNKPDRVVVGVRRDEVADRLHELYAPFLRTDRPFLVMSPESAEMTKYVANCLLATKISFINEMANLCEAYGADVNDVRRGIGHDQRIGFHFLFPGVGYGGSCFPKDIRAVDPHGAVQGPARADDGGRRRGQRGAEGRALPQDPPALPRRDQGQDHRRLGPGVQAADRRHPRGAALVLIEALLAAGAHVRVHDPEALANVRQLYGERLAYCDRPYGALEQADALAVATEWNEFRNPDFEVMRRLMRQPVIFDGRNVYDPARMAALGFTYHGIGRAGGAAACSSAVEAPSPRGPHARPVRLRHRRRGGCRRPDDVPVGERPAEPGRDARTSAVWTGVFAGSFVAAFVPADGDARIAVALDRRRRRGGRPLAELSEGPPDRLPEAVSGLARLRGAVHLRGRAAARRRLGTVQRDPGPLRVAGHRVDRGHLRLDRLPDPDRRLPRRARPRLLVAEERDKFLATARHFFDMHAEARE